MRLLICYDIADDRRRNHVSETLLDYGQRVQESVFECQIAPTLAAELELKLDHAITAMEDKLLIVRLCENCVQSVERRGLQLGAVDREFYIV